MTQHFTEDQQKEIVSIVKGLAANTGSEIKGDAICMTIHASRVARSDVKVSWVKEDPEISSLFYPSSGVFTTAELDELQEGLAFARKHLPLIEQKVNEYFQDLLSRMVRFSEGHVFQVLGFLATKLPSMAAKTTSPRQIDVEWMSGKISIVAAGTNFTVLVVYEDERRMLTHVAPMVRDFIRKLGYDVAAA